MGGGMSSLILDMREADPKFKYRVKAIPGAEKLTVCFQCGACTPDCPVAKRTDIFRPRRIVRLALLGFKKRLFSDNLLWLCLGCFSCTEMCPQGVKPTELIEALREMGAEEGILPPSIRDMMKALLSTGRIHRITKARERTRAKMGLPALEEPNMEELKTIFASSGLAELVGGKGVK